MSQPNTNPSSFFPLDYYMRPGEITNCIYASNDTTCPYICACSHKDLDKLSCEEGYVHASSFKNRKDDPNPLIVKCKNDTPSNLTSQHAKDSWFVGCLSGIKGRHKLFDPTKIDEHSCESLRKRSGWTDNGKSQS
jgi:hypothetical protein